MLRQSELDGQVAGLKLSITKCLDRYQPKFLGLSVLEFRFTFQDVLDQCVHI